MILGSLQPDQFCSLLPMLRLASYSVATFKGSTRLRHFCDKEQLKTSRADFDYFLEAKGGWPKLDQPPAQPQFGIIEGCRITRVQCQAVLVPR